MDQWHSRLNYNGREHITHTRITSGTSSSGDLEDCTTKTNKHLHQRSLITSLGTIVDLANIHRQTQKDNQERETKKYALNERMRYITVKIIK